MNISTAQLEQQGWLLGPLPKGALWRSLIVPDLKAIDLTLLGTQFGSILTIVLLSAISFLLGASALELVANRDLFFIMRGAVNLIGESRQGTMTRIRTLGPWTVTGETGAFSGYHAPYSAIAEKEGLVYQLNEENRKQMESENPELAAEFHRLIIIMISNQLMKANRAKVDSLD